MGGEVMANEKRLIDANEAFEMITDFAGQAETKSAYAAFWKSAKAIQQMSTVDAVEVVHGRWVLAKPRRKGRNATYRCTACGKLRSSYYNDVFQWEYCPCGAKMDGDGNG
jgi:hypothetical protein